MFGASTNVGSSGALMWLGVIAAGAFMVSWLLTEILHLRRGPYVGLLALLTGGLTGGYLVWSGAGVAFWTDRLLWGILGAVLAGGLLSAMVSRMSVRARDNLSGAASVWEGVVYGSAEGLLLSVLPVVVTWQLFGAIGWTSGWGALAAVVAALAASVAVIVVHHLGYREYRGPAMRLPVIGCSVLTVAYLLSGNPIAAMGGHTILHLAMLRRRVELPPHTHEERLPRDEVSVTARGEPIGTPAR